MKLPKNYKVGFVTFEKSSNRAEGSMGSTRIRARWVWNNWEEAEEWAPGYHYDVLIYQKVYWDKMMEEFNGIQILDLCDPDWLEGRDVIKYVDMVDAVTTSTPALAEYIRKYTSTPVSCVPDRLELAEHKEKKVEHRGKLTDVAWFGYSGNFVYIEGALDILEKLGIKLTVYSDSMMELPEKNSKLRFEWRKYDYKDIHSKLIMHDALILPENRGGTTVRGKFKSNNKTITAQALGIPVISNAEDFNRLMSKEAREEEAKIKMEQVRKEYDIKKSVEDYKEIIQSQVGK